MSKYSKIGRDIKEAFDKAGLGVGTPEVVTANLTVVNALLEQLEAEHRIAMLVSTPGRVVGVGLYRPVAPYDTPAERVGSTWDATPPEDTYGTPLRKPLP